ncbi:MAG: type II secretion system minor pseudopilin GspK [Gammaproteobacteria bacterium]|nr:type II secretion system minor pseudopilin GspK [Gammaproteobacteria bacterium]
MISRFSHKGWLPLPVRQQGIALVTALFIFSLVTIAAIAMAERQVLDIRRTENLLHYDQAYMYALGAEAWAGQLLLKDPDKKVDHYGELPEEPLVVPVDGGSIVGYIRDATARFPVNNLIDDKGKKSEVYVNAFQRFFNDVVSGGKCGEQESFNPDLASVLLDWLDKNETPSVGGAEDPAYLSHELPYRTANHRVASISELRSLSGIIAEEYNCLVVSTGDSPPLVNAIPAADVAINVNTAFPEVLQSLHNLVDAAVVSNLMEVRSESKDEAPYKTVDKFLDDLKDEIDFNSKTAEERNKIDAALKKIKLSVGSQYFEVTSIVQIGRMQLTLISLLKRDEKKISTLRRSIGVN